MSGARFAGSRGGGDFDRQRGTFAAVWRAELSQQPRVNIATAKLQQHVPSLERIHPVRLASATVVPRACVLIFVRNAT